MKHIFTFLFAVALASIATVGVNNASAYDMQRLLLGTSSAGGSYYNIGAGWSNIVNQNLKNMDVTVEVTGGPTSNIQLIEKTEMDLGLVTAWAGGEAFTGTGWAKEHGAYEAFLSMFPTHSSYLWIYTLKDSGINTVYDFEGKHISTGPAGSTSHAAGHALLKVFGIEPSNISELPSGAQINSIKDGTIDAVFGVTGSPAPWLLDLETTHDFKLIQLSEDEFSKAFKAFPFWSADEIPANTYKNQTEAYQAISFWNFVVIRKDIQEAVVYDLVKTTYEHYDDVQAISKATKGFDTKNLPKIVVPLHPGAIKYYKEKGIEVPNKLIAK